MVVLRILFFTAILTFVHAATWMGRPPAKPAEFADKKGCYVKEINDVIPYGTSVTPIGFCYRIECSPTLMDYASCGVVSTKDHRCYITNENTSKPYPDCCPEVKCEYNNRV